ncbi:MAG: hypothetical protein ABTQ27_00565 [Amaricoccus sp.]|uniref:DUF6932 family protein n=1 Tax=Amaricoccus sp. TaxID=1872485 RepID=UPI00331475B5
MIPNWNMEGVLPPIWPGEDGTSPNRAPYTATTTELVDQFGITPTRLNIIEGLLDYRSALYDAGIVKGFQWLDGSFMEHIELHSARPPNDIDVVTFFELPAGETQAALAARTPHLFDHDRVKANYKVDSYNAILGETLAEHHVRVHCYWYSMWSHNRNQTWKGFVRIELGEAEDTDARLVLASKRAGP